MVTWIKNVCSTVNLFKLIDPFCIKHCISLKLTNNFLSQHCLCKHQQMIYKSEDRDDFWWSEGENSVSWLRFFLLLKKQQENVECSQHAILPGEILGCFRRQWVVDLLWNMIVYMDVQAYIVCCKMENSSAGSAWSEML